MAIAPELLDSFNDPELAKECERVSIYLRIVVSAWDGLSQDEADKLSAPAGMKLLSDEEAKAIFDEQLKGILAGDLVEDALLEKVREFMGKVSEGHRALIGKALFNEAASALSVDGILSRQEREVMQQEIAPVLLMPTDEVLEALAKVDAELAAAKAPEAAAAAPEAPKAEEAPKA